MVFYEGKNMTKVYKVFNCKIDQNIERVEKEVHCVWRGLKD